MRIRYYFVFAAFIFAVLGCSALDNARTVVRNTLKKNGLRVGVNSSIGTYISIGYHSVDTNQVDSILLHRESFCQRAVLRAKHDILSALKLKVSLRDEVEMRDDDSRPMILTKSMCEYMAEASLQGAVVLTSAESWDRNQGRYEVAVAVGWSRKIQEDARRTLNAGMSSEQQLEESPEWGRYIKELYLPSVMGSRQFVDSRGVRRFMGVGFADLDAARTPLQRRNAIRLSNLHAARNLGFALDSDSAMHDTARTLCRMMESGTLKEVDAWEEFVSRMSQKCSREIRGHEVYSADKVVHPLTGHRLYVSVYGVDP